MKALDQKQNRHRAEAASVRLPPAICLLSSPFPLFSACIISRLLPVPGTPQRVAEQQRATIEALQSATGALAGQTAQAQRHGLAEALAAGSSEAHVAVQRAADRPSREALHGSLLRLLPEGVLEAVAAQQARVPAGPPAEGGGGADPPGGPKLWPPAPADTVAARVFDPALQAEVDAGEVELPDHARDESHRVAHVAAKVRSWAQPLPAGCAACMPGRSPHGRSKGEGSCACGCVRAAQFLLPVAANTVCVKLIRPEDLRALTTWDRSEEANVDVAYVALQGSVLTLPAGGAA